MALDFSSTTGLPEETAETRNARLPAAAPILEPGAPTDLELMNGIQAEDPDALSQLYDRYNGIIKALILRVIHNEAEADDLLQEIFMEIWNQAKNFSAQRGKPLGWMVTLARRRAIDGLRKKQAYARAEERLQQETEQQPEAWVHDAGRLFVVGALEQDEMAEFENARREFGEKAEAFISECYSLSEAFALSLKPAKASDQIKARLMEMVKNRQAH